GDDSPRNCQDLSLEPMREARRIRRLASSAGRLLVPCGISAHWSCPRCRFEKSTPLEGQIHESATSRPGDPRNFPLSPFFGHKSASDVQPPLSRRSSPRFWVRRSADAGLRYYQELTSLDEQALHRIAPAAGRSL